jgi:hypothetical protein
VKKTIWDRYENLINLNMQHLPASEVVSLEHNGKSSNVLEKSITAVRFTAT